MGRSGVQLIVDAFSFFGAGAELDLLEIRLHELDCRGQIRVSRSDSHTFGLI